MSTAVKRACDACHRRKVKCDGINPCRNCSASQLSCTYNAIPQKKGPKGSRAKVINELKEKERQTSLTAKVQNRMNGLNNQPTSPTLAPTPGLLQGDMIKECLEFFFAHMYPMMPILHRQRLEQQAMYMDQSLDTYCLLTSLCAFVLLQPGMTVPGTDPFSFDSMPGANIVTSTLLMEETIRVRKGYDYMDSPSLNSLCTSYFLYGCYYAVDLHDRAWFHLREAMTLVHMVGMNKETTYRQFDSIESSRRRRLYWLFFVTERVYALQRGRPLTLQASINLPAPNDDPTDPAPHQLTNFISLVNVFRPYDDALVNLWSKTKAESTPSYLSTLQKQLQEVLPHGYLENAQAQLSELQPNQQWLKNTTWQLSTANPGDSDSGLPPYPSPVDIGRDLLPMVSHLPGNLGLPGLRLVEKLLTITFSLTEALAMQPTTRTPFTVGPREHLHQILNVATVLRYGDHRFLPLLLSKVQDALPRLASPMLHNAPESTTPCDIDIFDGFGNAGMAQPSCYSDEYETKFSVSRLDEISPESGSPSGGPSNHDMNSPFASSPPIMSPGIDIPHTIPSEFTSMPEMVMSPMSHAPPSSLGTPGGLNNQQPQHAQQTPISPFSSMNPQMQGLSLNNLNSPPNISLASQVHHNPGLGTGMNGGLGQPVNNNGLISRPQPQRANSFAIGAPHLRTVGDFQALQRVNSDMSAMSPLGMNTMGREIDFNTLPR
ncbi:maltose fermentation regulatory protein MAL33 [Echria macrotheca]|uniref:Maltose fermentation regulatory protein MAL33 n=1 Tax=Echria macrotheca TaxID=438768 RepID=A0AAJ0BGS5_9PEZI|nr:maltose fermentation regulatory protein MAL33 [Echria macrotheca]